MKISSNKKNEIIKSLQIVIENGTKNANAANFSVEQLCQKISDDSLVIPAYQRGFKWKKNQIAALYNSMFFSKAPIAGLAINKISEPSHYIPCVDFLNRERIEYSKMGTDRICIVDGQHRIASLYMAFSNNSEVEEIVYNTTKQVFTLKSKSNALQIPITVLFSKSISARRKFVSELDIKDDEFNDTLHDYLSKMNQQFNGYVFSAVVANGLSEKQQNDWFITLNKAGTTVSTNHLYISPILTAGFNVYKEFTEIVVDKLKSFGYSVDLVLTEDTKISFPLALFVSTFEKETRNEHSTSWSPLINDVSSKLKAIVESMKKEAKSNNTGLDLVAKKYFSKTLKNLEITFDFLNQNKELKIENSKPLNKLSFVYSALNWVGDPSKNQADILVKFYLESQFTKGGNHAPNRSLFNKLLFELGMPLKDKNNFINIGSWNAKEYDIEI